MHIVAAALVLAATLTPEPNRAVRDSYGGGSRSFVIASKILEQQRRVFIHTPPSFDKTTHRYPVMILFDGEFLMQPVVTVADVLTQEGQMPESVIVAIESTDDYDGRVHDLTPPGLSVSGSSRNEGGGRFLDFVEKELLPSLDAQFRTGTPRTLIGTSSGGILVTYAAATRETYRNHLALDTPTHLGDGWLSARLLERARTKPNVPMRYVSYGARFGWTDDAWKRIVAVASPAWQLHSEDLPHESHNSMQFLGSYLGLRELFHDYSMLTAPEWPTTTVLPYYEKLSMIPPAPLLERVVEDLLMEGRGALARKAFDLLVTSYGEPRDAAELRARIAEVEKLPPPSETVEGLLATPFPSVVEMRDYLGDWEGESWVNPEDKHRQVLQLRVENGKVIGTYVSYPEPGVEMAQKVEYLKITPEGLTFGFMNGMRPRGVLLNEGQRTDDGLAGVMRFGGVNFIPPPGLTLPTHRFALRKKAP
jgi:hypothetical protein